jgi:hypothetical protein
MSAMELAFWIAFASGFAIVAASLVGVALDRAPTRSFLAATVVLALGAGACVAALVMGLPEGDGERSAALAAAAGLAGAAVAEAGLIALRLALRRLREQDRFLASGQQRIASLLESHADERVRELEQTLARERANASHVLGQQERKLGIERRDAVARQADRARAELARSIEQVQERLEQRLTAWAADLDRGQRALETRLTELATRQNEAIKAYEARLAADSEQLRAVTDEQQAALTRLRLMLQQVGREVLEEGRAEIEAHGDERRRALQEIATRLRDQERDLRAHVEREEAEAVARVTSSFADVERRQRENLERALDRAAGRLAEEAERRFDAQIRQSREKSAQRLSHELDRAMEQFAKQAEKAIADRINEAARTSASRLERRIADITRAADVQHEIASERMNQLSARLNEAVAQAERRIAAFEAQVETEVAARLEVIERSIRAADV